MPHPGQQTGSIECELQSRRGSDSYRGERLLLRSPPTYVATCVIEKQPTWRWRRGRFRGFLSSGTPSAQDNLPAGLVVQLRPVFKRQKECFSSTSLDLLDYHFLWFSPGLFSPGGRNTPSCGNPDGDYSFTKMMKFSPGLFWWDFLLDLFSLHF